MTHLQRAIADGHARLSGEGKNEKIHYVAANHTERFSDPEEKVRAEFWAELHYRLDYSFDRIRFEVTVPRRTPGDWADLVIYRDDECKDDYAVIECKKDGISDMEFFQSIEQACGNRASLSAPFAGVVAGGTRRFFDFRKSKPGERQTNIIADLPPRYGNPPEWRYYKGGVRIRPGGGFDPAEDLGAVPREDLRGAIRKCHQTLWEGGKRNAMKAFGEFCKIVFVKIRDEVDRQRKKGEPYTFQRRTGESAADLAERINALYDAERAREPDVFTDRINVEAPILAQVVDHLEGISLSKTDLDTKGVAFEEFMGGFFKGAFGQYFTPRELIAFSVHMLRPTVDDLALDPACGSGGFLLYLLDYIRNEASRRFPDHESDPDEREQWTHYWHDFAKENIHGIEIDDDIARVAKMNMIIHDDGHTHVVGHDALDFIPALKKKNPRCKPGAFSLVLTNPPFGSVIKETEKGNDYLDQFTLRRHLGKNADAEESAAESLVEGSAKKGAKTIKARASVKTEILFLERVHTYLKPGTGRAAVILPDGILTNSSLQGVRDWLLERFQLLAVVSLPQFAFAHYDAGVKASIVFLRRLAEGERVPDSAPIFMALAENIGYDATGRKSFTVEPVSLTEGVKKVEIQRSDLFDYRVEYEWSTANPKRIGWSERHREVIPGTGLVAQWEAFQKNPKPFFV